MADTEMKYFAKLGLDSSEFMKGLSQSSVGLLSFARDVSVTMQMTLMLFDRVMAQVRKFGEMAMELRDLSYTTGIASEQLQRMRYAAILSGTSFYTVTTSLQKLSLSVNDFADSSSIAAKAFSEIGIDPTGKPVDQVFDETVLALHNMKSETLRNSIAMDIFGKSWKDLIPYMDTYIDKKAEIKATPVISDKELADLAEAKVGWDKLTNSFTIYTGKVLAWALNPDNPYKDQKSKPGDALRAIGYLGVTPAGAGGRGGEVIPSDTQQEVAIIKLTDKFAGLNDQEIELVQTADDLRQAIKDQAKALDSGNKEAFDKASARVALLTNRYYELAAAMMTAQAASGSSNAVIGGGWNPLSVVGTEGSNMQLFLAREMNLGVSYEQALKNWAFETPTQTAGTLSAIGGKSVIININNPKGTPAEIAAATKAGMRQSGTALSVGGA